MTCIYTCIQRVFYIYFIYLIIFVCAFVCFIVDATRVILTDVDPSVSGSDYINANLIEVQMILTTHSNLLVSLFSVSVHSFQHSDVTDLVCVWRGLILIALLYFACFIMTVIQLHIRSSNDLRIANYFPVHIIAQNVVFSALPDKKWIPKQIAIKS